MINRSASTANKAQETLTFRLRDWLGCTGLLFALCLVCGVGTLVVMGAMEFRKEMIPAYARLAWRIADGSRPRMAAMAWIVWTIPVATASGIGFLRKRQRLLFRVLLAPCALLVAGSWLFTDIRNRGGGHEPWIGDLVATVPDGDAFAVGLNCASAAGIGAYFVMMFIAGLPHAGIRVSWLVRLTPALLMPPALIIALLRV